MDSASKRVARILHSRLRNLGCLTERCERYARNQQRANQLAVIVGIVKVEEKPGFWNMREIRVRHMQLPAVGKKYSEWSKGSFTKKCANLFKHEGKLISRPHSASC
jgi:hypothetical protein